ncbi:Hypothetical protein NTJ_14108 [Nesidiocoris tenuis]|uniref:Uncharacterized protein n=1 Tax=Nesidiocoris tenuis TaxID=355587 RepID=A0ABN7BA73_9HEMI|nr:Hypothetical protein NTJ_14108 [Nesidiocoris tenuis]
MKGPIVRASCCLMYNYFLKNHHSGFKPSAGKELFGFVDKRKKTEEKVDTYESEFLMEDFTSADSRPFSLRTKMDFSPVVSIEHRKTFTKTHAASQMADG